MSQAADTLVIGAGPAGLAVASALTRRGIGVDLVDRHGTPGGAYSRMYSPLMLSSPTRYLGLQGLSLRSANRYLAAGEYAEYLSAYAREAGLRVETGRVTGLRRLGAVYSVTLDAGSQPRRYASVVVATGMCDSPVIPAGLETTVRGSTARPAVVHSRDWKGPPIDGGSRVLIVGSGMRGVELAEECARGGARVLLSSRRGSVRAFPRQVAGIDLRHLTFPLLGRTPNYLVKGRCEQGWRFPGIDRGFRGLVARGKIEVRGRMARLHRGRATFDDGSSWWPDLVVLATGYRFETPFLDHDIPRAAPGYPLVRRSESPALPNLFFLGIPCAFGADSQFLHGAARDAEAVAATVARRRKAARAVAD